MCAVILAYNTDIIMSSKYVSVDLLCKSGFCCNYNKCEFLQTGTDAKLMEDKYLEN